MNYKTTLQRFMTLLMVVILFTGFTGNEKYLELSGYLNARGSAKFRKIDRNILGVLATGTRGEVLERKKMASGNYGFKVEVLDGSLKGRKVWVYYNRKNPDLKLYDVKPQEWEDVYREPAEEESAVGVETVRETPALADPEESEVTAEEQAQAPIDEAQNALQNMVGTNAESAQKILSSMRPEPRPSSVAGCSDCFENPSDSSTVTILAGRRPIVRNGVVIFKGTTVSDRCDTFMSNKGQIGSNGDKILAEMMRPGNSEKFFRSNAMGAMCPNFASLSQTQKIKAWMWFWVSLADVESRCDSQVEHPISVNGVPLNLVEGIGYFAMERYQADRDEKGRGSKCRGDMRSEDLQISCAVDIMAISSLDQGRTLTTDRSNYWGPLNRYRNTEKEMLLPKMQRFAQCFN